MPQLRYIDDNGTLQTLTLGAQPVLIGRVATCSIAFVDDMISREHSRIDRETDGRYRVRDLGSRNKTHVNGEQVAETLLSPGDTIRVGDHVLEYLDPDVQREPANLEFLTPDTQDPADCEWARSKAPLTLSVGQVEQLAQLAAHWGLTSRPEDIADQCLSQIILDLQAERGFVAVRGEEKHALRPITQRGLLRPPGGALTPVSQTFASAPLLQKVAGRYPQSGKNIDARSGFAATAVVAPLTYRGTPLGVIYVDRAQSRQAFPPAALQYLAAAGASVGASMAAATRRLTETIGLEEAAWVSALRRAHEALQRTPESNETFEIAYRLLPGAGRRGDLCEVVHVDEQRSLLVLADGGGQGAVGLAQAAAIRAAAVAACHIHPDEIDLAGIVNTLNGLMARSAARQLVGCALVLCDLSAGRIQYVNAGLPPPTVLAGPGRLITLDQPSLLLGLDADYLYEATAVDLPARFRLVACTDGLIDAVNASHEPFGERRAHEVLLDKDAFGHPDDILKRLTEAFFAHVAGSAPHDDATVIVMGRG